MDDDDGAFKDDVRAERVELGRSAVRDVTAASVRIEQSAVQRVTAETVVAERSAIGVANATTLELKESSAAIAAGDYVRVEESRVFVLLAPRVSGTVHAVLTLPAAFAFGAGYFLARRLVTAIFGRGGR